MTCFVFLGNPGCGKSTLIKSLCKQAHNRDKIRNGNSDGGGLTKNWQYYEDDGHTYIDTPGMAEMDLRDGTLRTNESQTQKNMNQIRSALQYAANLRTKVKIIFVMRDNGVRFDAEDFALVIYILSRLKPEMGSKIRENTYSIFFNQIPCKEVIDLYEEKVHSLKNRAAFRAGCRDAEINMTNQFFYQLSDFTIAGRDGLVLTGDRLFELRKTLQQMPICDISDCAELRVQQYEKTAEKCRNRECFPASATCDYMSNDGIKSKKILSDLNYGDLVKTFVNKKVKYEPIIAFTSAQDDIEAEFIEFTFDNEKKMAITKLHMIMGSDRKTYFRAADVEIGQKMLSVKEDGFETEVVSVISIKNTVKKGLYGPVTLSGNIIINEIVESCYAEHRINLLGYQILSAHSQAHTYLLPYRIYVESLGGLKKLKNTSKHDHADMNGTHPYIYKMRKFFISKQIEKLMD